MKLREALITMAPSLALQRAAADEIARLDKLLEVVTEQLAQRLGTNSEEWPDARAARATLEQR